VWLFYSGVERVSLYGYRATIAANYLTVWGKHTHDRVLAFSGDPARVEQSVARCFQDRHMAVSQLKGELGVAKKDFSSSTWKGFVNVSLTAEQKESFGAWDIQDADVWDGLATYGERGYKFSLTYNRTNASWVGTFTGQEGTGKNEGWAVTGFAKDPYNAARVLLFKVSAVLTDVWGDYKPLPSDEIG
jgi:hypothetical protein